MPNEDLKIGGFKNPKWEKFFTAIAHMNGAATATVKFNVLPGFAKKLESAIMAETGFLKSINNLQIKGLRGGKIYSGLGTPITKRTQVQTDPVTGMGTELRRPIATTVDTEDEYDLAEWEQDAILKWKRADEMAEQDGYQLMYRKNLTEQAAVDRQTVCWQGTERKLDTTTYNLEQMDRSILLKLKDANPGNVIEEIVENEGVVVVGELDGITAREAWANGADYKFKDWVTTVEGGVTHSWICLRSHTSDSGTPGKDQPNIASMDTNEYWHIKPHFSNFDSLVTSAETRFQPAYLGADCDVLCPREIITAERDWYYTQQKPATPSEKTYVETAARKFGARDTRIIPYMPEDALMITKLKNISWVTQKGSHRRQIEDSSEYKGIADFNFFNGAFEIENYRKAVAILNIRFLDLNYLEKHAPAP